MKIVYCIHSLYRPGGIERVVTTKANYLAEVFGHEVAIIVSRPNPKGPSFRISEKIRTFYIDVNDHLFLSAYTKKLNALLCALKPDITISVCGSELKAIPKCTDGSTRIAEFHFSHEKFLMKYGSNLPGRLYAKLRTRRLEKQVSAFDRFVTLTKADQKDWLGVLDNVSQIYNPLSFSLKGQSGLTRKRCIAAGRLEQQKNISDAIRAWRKVAGKHPDWTFDIYGEGRLRKSLQQEINEYGLEDKIHLMGCTREIQKELLDCSCLVMSSKFEGFPLILIEGLSAGLPLVSYDCPKGPSEIVRNGSNGFLVRSGDTDALAEGICRVIEDEDLRRRFGTESKKLSEDFSIDRIMAQWEDLFKEVVNGRQSSR